MEELNVTPDPRVAQTNFDPFHIITAGDEPAEAQVPKDARKLTRVGVAD